MMSLLARLVRKPGSDRAGSGRAESDRAGSDRVQKFKSLFGRPLSTPPKTGKTSEKGILSEKEASLVSVQPLSQKDKSKAVKPLSNDQITEAGLERLKHAQKVDLP